MAIYQKIIGNTQLRKIDGATDNFTHHLSTMCAPLSLFDSARNLYESATFKREDKLHCMQNSVPEKSVKAQKQCDIKAMQIYRLVNEEWKRSNR